MQNQNASVAIRNEGDLKVFLHKNYLHQIKNFFGDEAQAMKFLSSVINSVQKTPELLKCEPMSLVNSFMTMAQLGLMPSNVSGEAYVLPYKGIAQFQLGYQGLITLFYRAGGTGIRSEIVRKNDTFSYENGKMSHKIDMTKSNKERGEPIGAYAIANVNGEEIAKFMNQADILDMGKNFSKSFNTSFTPWKAENDPELWMWKKTVLKQLGKLLPKNETINQAIAEDNKESRLHKVEGLIEGNTLAMGNFAKKPNGKEKAETEENGDATIRYPEGDDDQGEAGK